MKNQLVAEYLGEVYIPSEWKREILINEKAKKLGIIPADDHDFYNMNFDRHKDDPDGVGLIVIDPTKKGNFCSRMNHSCIPNVGIVPIISNGKYHLAAYATRDIKEGDQLTFDYSSVTDDKEESCKATCLWGESIWKGNYIDYVESHQDDFYRDKHHDYIHRF